METMLLAYSQADGAFASYAGARGAILLLMFTGIVKCLQIARRPQTNARACYALGLLVGSLLLLSSIDLLLRWPQRENLLSVDPLLIRAAAALIAFACLIASLVLSLLAHSEIRGDRERYLQGSRQAAWAFVLSSLMLAVGGYGFVTSFTQQVRLQQTAAGPATGPGPTFDSVATPPGSPEVFRDEEQNFAFTPPAGWFPAPRLQEDPKLRYAISQAAPEMHMMILAEPVGDLVYVSGQDLIRAVQHRIEMTAQKVEVVRVEPRTIHGIDGTQMVIRLEKGPLSFSYVFWAGVHNGRAYQQILWSHPRDEWDLVASADAMFEGFRLIDADRQDESLPARGLVDYHSPGSGFSLQLNDGEWVQLDGIENLGTGAEVGAVSRDGLSVAVSALPLRGTQPPLPAVVRGILALYEIEANDPRIAGRTSIQQGDSAGVQFDVTTTTDLTPARYRFQVCSRNDRAYMICVYGAEADFDLAAVDSALQGFALTDAVAEFEPSAQPQSQQKAHAVFFNGLGLYAYEQGDFSTSLGHFERASDLDPQDNVYLTNLVDTLFALERLDEAAATLDERLEAVWDPGRLPAMRAFLYSASGGHAKAMAMYADLFAGGYWNEEDFLAYIDVIWEHKDAESAIAELARYITAHGSPLLTSLQGDLLVDAGRADEAVTVLQAGFASQASEEIAISLMAACRSAGDPQQALTLAEDLVSSGDPGAGVWLQKGLTEFDLQQYTDAKASFETANELMPGVSLIEDLLASATAILGQSDSRLVSTPIDPVPLPEGLEPASLLGHAKESDGSGARNDWQIQAIHFARDEDYTKTVYRSFTIEDDSAIEGLRTLSFTFNPLFERLYLNRLVVFDDQGEQVASTDRHQCYLTSQTASGEATEEQTLNIPVPALRPGHRVEVVVTTQDTVPPERFPYEFFAFASSYPTTFDLLVIRGDVDAVQFAGVEPSRQTADELIWVQRHRPAFAYEEDQPPTSEFLPVVELADASANWEAEIREYLETIAELRPVPERTRELARQIVAEAPGQDVVAALAQYVQSRFTYQALEFGRHKRVMRSSEEVIANQYGDCKDLSLLLWHLLREHEIDAHLALVHSSGELTTELPTVDQCDHMVVYLPEGGRILDPTVRWGNPQLPVTRSLGGSTAVILDEQKPRIATLMPCPSDQFRTAVRVTTRLDEDGTAHIEETLTLTGYIAVGWRAAFGGLSSRDRNDALRQYLTVSVPGVEVKSLEIDHLQEVTAPLVIRLSGTVRHALHESADGFVGPLPRLSRMPMVSLDEETARRTPFAIRQPRTYETTVQLSCPAGWGLELRSPHAERSHDEFVHWSRHSEQSGPLTLLQTQIDKPLGQFPAFRRREYRDRLNLAAAATAPTLELRRSTVPVQTVGGSQPVSR